MVSNKHILSVIWLAIFFLACATPQRPEGGPKDEMPPQIDSLKTTANYQTNFEQRSIEITFDEWVKLGDVFNQVVVSPPLEKEPSITLKKKTVLFEFDEEEVLREDATYTINFGDAVKDITEGNPATDLRYVFSTGNEIDSLEMSGTVVDAVTQEPMEDVLVLLYDNLQDSVVRTERPFYFAKSDEGGYFKIKNIKAGVFKVFGLKDANLNYKFDVETEAIGFLDSFITITDTIPTTIRVEMFEEETQLRLIDDEVFDYGLVNLTFNRNPYDVNIRYNIEDIPYTETIGDTLKIWYNTVDSFQIFVQADTSLNDTILVPVATKKNEFLEKNRFYQLNSSASGKPKSKNPTVDLGIEMNHPIARFELDSIQLLEDTTRIRVIPEVRIDSLDQRLLKIKYPWKESITYYVEIPPNGLQSIWGMPNDTIEQGYKILSKDDFGSLNVVVDSLEADQDYIIKLMTVKKDIVQEDVVSGQTSFEQSYTSINAGEYMVQIIEDRNKNGRWDTGNYDDKRKPERIFEKKLESLRANWTVDAVVILNF